MTDQRPRNENEDEAAASLRSVEELGARTRLARSGRWFVLLVFGAVTLGALPFYVITFATARTPGCRAYQGGLACEFRGRPSNPLGRAFTPLSSPFDLGRWATVYWVAAMAVGFCAVVAFYRHRSRAVGVKGRIWPLVVVGLGLLGAVVIVENGPSYFPALPDLWIRGMGALLVLAVGIVVLAVLERSWAFALFAAGFIGLALLSCLYNDDNLFYRVGIGSPFGGGGGELPNLIVPGIYLLLGGIGFWLGDHRARRALVGPA